jgi:hypothetical protein
LQTQILEIEIVGALPLLRGPRGLLSGALLGAVALDLRRPQQLFQRGGIFG